MVPLITDILRGTITYPSIIERKLYVRSPRLFKTNLFNFERYLGTHKKRSVKNLINRKIQEFSVSFSD